MKLSIIIVNWNTRELLRRCLASISSASPQVSCEIWVVENGSADGSLEMVRSEFPHARLIANPANLGFARANNQAIAQSTGEYLLLLNSDTLVRPGALEGMLQVAERYPGAGVVGCRLLNPDGTIQESWAKFPTLASELAGKNIRGRKLADPALGLYEVDWVGGACLLARKSAVEQVGPLDEGFFMYSEEVDWCYRMSQCGWKVYYLESVETVHSGGGSAKRSSPDQLIRLHQSKLRFFAKHYGKRQAAFLRAGLVLVNLLGCGWCALEGLLLSSKAALCDQRATSKIRLVKWLVGRRAFPSPETQPSTPPVA